MALSLQQEQQSQDLQWEQLPEGISDLELAKKLQEEEDRRASQYYQEQEQEQAAAAAAAAAQAQVGMEEGTGSRWMWEETWDFVAIWKRLLLHRGNVLHVCTGAHTRRSQNTLWLQILEMHLKGPVCEI